jgi:hypothetical protein
MFYFGENLERLASAVSFSYFLPVRADAFAPLSVSRGAKSIKNIIK